MPAEDFRCGERGMSAPPSNGRSWSAIRAAHARAQHYEDCAETCAQHGHTAAAAHLRAQARAALAPFRPAHPSTFPGEQPSHIDGQLSL